MKYMENENKTYRNEIVCFAKRWARRKFQCPHEEMCPVTSENIVYTGILSLRCVATYETGFVVKKHKGLHEPIKSYSFQNCFEF